MSYFKSVAQITVSNIGGELDSIHANSTDSEDIKEALFQLVQNGIFEIGDTIRIEEVETEIE